MIIGEYNAKVKVPSFKDTDTWKNWKGPEYKENTRNIIFTISDIQSTDLPHYGDKAQYDIGKLKKYAKVKFLKSTVADVHYPNRCKPMNVADTCTNTLNGCNCPHWITCKGMDCMKRTGTGTGDNPVPERCAQKCRDCALNLADKNYITIEESQQKKWRRRGTQDATWKSLLPNDYQNPALTGFAGNSYYHKEWSEGVIYVGEKNDKGGYYVFLDIDKWEGDSSHCDQSKPKPYLSEFDFFQTGKPIYVTGIWSPPTEQSKGGIEWTHFGDHTRTHGIPQSNQVGEGVIKNAGGAPQIKVRKDGWLETPNLNNQARGNCHASDSVPPGAIDSTWPNVATNTRCITEDQISAHNTEKEAQDACLADATCKSIYNQGCDGSGASITCKSTGTSSDSGGCVTPNPRLTSAQTSWKSCPLPLTPRSNANKSHKFIGVCPMASRYSGWENIDGSSKMRTVNIDTLGDSTDSNDYTTVQQSSGTFNYIQGDLMKLAPRKGGAVSNKNGLVAHGQITGITTNDSAKRCADSCIRVDDNHITCNPSMYKVEQLNVIFPTKWSQEVVCSCPHGTPVKPDDCTTSGVHCSACDTATHKLEGEKCVSKQTGRSQIYIKLLNKTTGTRWLSHSGSKYHETVGLGHPSDIVGDEMRYRKWAVWSSGTDTRLEFNFNRDTGDLHVPSQSYMIYKNLDILGADGTIKCEESPTFSEDVLNTWKANCDGMTDCSGFNYYKQSPKKHEVCYRKGNIDMNSVYGEGKWTHSGGKKQEVWGTCAKSNNPCDACMGKAGCFALGQCRNVLQKKCPKRRKYKWCPANDEVRYTVRPADMDIAKGYYDITQLKNRLRADGNSMPVKECRKYVMSGGTHTWHRPKPKGRPDGVTTYIKGEGRTDYYMSYISKLAAKGGIDSDKDCLKSVCDVKANKKRVNTEASCKSAKGTWKTTSGQCPPELKWGNSKKSSWERGPWPPYYKDLGDGRLWGTLDPTDTKYTGNGGRLNIQFEPNPDNPLQGHLSSTINGKKNYLDWTAGSFDARDQKKIVKNDKKCGDGGTCWVAWNPKKPSTYIIELVKV